VNDLVFESTLLYVYLPDLCRFSSSEVHAAVSKFFLWLEKKDVTTIVELNIPDNHMQPLSDEFVFDKVARFNVRNLDWRRIDMNLDFLIESRAAASLTDLHLYSSGNWSTLYHWASAEEFNGLSALPQVCCIMVYGSRSWLIFFWQIREIKLNFVEPKPSSVRNSSKASQQCDTYMYDREISCARITGQGSKDTWTTSSKNLQLCQ
jgi:hypothetical protein